MLTHCHIVMAYWETWINRVIGDVISETCLLKVSAVKKLHEVQFEKPGQEI